MSQSQSNVQSMQSTVAQPNASQWSGAAVREAFLRYFEAKRSHKRLPSASLVPANNPTVLLTPAGMLPFVPIFLGIEPTPTPPRVTSSQKCARVSGKASDLESVGRTRCHHTFFEMLGNFSFGDYFKTEIIPWAWEFVTQELGLPAERLWVSVFREDEESYRLWKEQVGVPEERIFRCDEKDNFWGPPGPTGPCGPCTEIHYDMYPDRPELTRDERLMEIWNLVFMEFFKDAEGQLSPLEHKNVDTGMGLERITMVLQQKANTFETDLLFPIIRQLETLSGFTYGQSEPVDVALKIVADHARFVAFALMDGVRPSNEGRGYILRMILRRAVRYGRRFLGFTQPFMHQLMPVVAGIYREHYPTLTVQQEPLAQSILQEEQRFLETLDRGSKSLEEILQKTKQFGKTEISGDDVFKLYDTYGFPVELTADIAVEEGFTLDIAGFEAAMDNQRHQARSSRKAAAIVSDQVFSDILASVGESRFVGYETLSAQATVMALVVDGERVASVSGTNQPFQCVLDVTPFYAESGGQVGDRGALLSENGPNGLTVVVKNTQKVGQLVVHDCLFDQGACLKVGDSVLAEVEASTRQLSALHHTSTHLVHAALRQVLGPEVSQAGSSVGPEGARFDFSFNRGLTESELLQVEALVNRWILENSVREEQYLSLEEAKKAGAIAMFDEKYGDVVRVIAYGGFSKELCGGTHVDQLGQIGLIKIVSETAIAAGTRRIEFVCGELAYRQFKRLEARLEQAALLLKVPEKDLLDKIQRLQEELKLRERQLEALEAQQSMQTIRAWLGELKESGYFQQKKPICLLKNFSNTSPDNLKRMAEALESELKKVLAFDSSASVRFVALFASAYEEKAHFVSVVSDSMVAQGFRAGDLVKQAALLCQGNGGGRPQFAQAGGKDASQIEAALLAVEGRIRQSEAFLEALA